MYEESSKHESRKNEQLKKNSSTHQFKRQQTQHAMLPISGMAPLQRLARESVDQDGLFDYYRAYGFSRPRSKKTAQLKQNDVSSNAVQSDQVMQQKANNTGLPDNLKSGIERLSGQSMDDVKVHYNSDKPAQLQAHAYAQGTDIHLGAGQEKHLPHEAWHVVQQKQGRVKPTLQMKSQPAMQMKVNVNDDKALEKEADIMGAKANQISSNRGQGDFETATPHLQNLDFNGIVQRAFDKKGNGLKDIYDNLLSSKDLKPLMGTIDEIPPKYSTYIDRSVTKIEKDELPNWVVNSFKDNEYRTVLTDKEITVYRVYGKAAKESGAFVSTVPVNNKIDAKIDLALLPEWKNTRQYEATIVIPAGEKLNIGRVASQTIESTGTILKGDADQILMPQNWPKEWIKSTSEIQS